MKEDLLKSCQIKIEQLSQELKLKTQEVLSVHQLLADRDKRIEKLENERERMSKIESEFISNVSHELRTPLTSVIQGLELIIDKSLGDINNEQKKILKIVYTETKRFSRLIEDVIDISRIEFGKMSLIKSAVNINTLIREVADPLRKEFRDKNLEFNITIPEEDIFVFADPKRIAQVVFNLLENALRFTQEGGVYLQMNNLGGEVVVSVKDTGPGIKEADMDKLFKKFQQFSRTEGPGKKGTGLGLAICKGIVQMHKGKMRVDSKIGEGSNFLFSLPRYEKKILLIDNEEDIGVILKTKFARVHIPMDYATTLSDALKNLGVTSYSLILLDLTLPETSYREAIESVREIYGGPVIIFSARDEDELERVKKEIDADDFIRKPFDFAFLKEKIEKFMGAK